MYTCKCLGPECEYTQSFCFLGGCVFTDIHTVYVFFQYTYFDIYITMSLDILCLNMSTHISVNVHEFSW